MQYRSTARPSLPLASEFGAAVGITWQVTPARQHIEAFFFLHDRHGKPIQTQFFSPSQVKISSEKVKSEHHKAKWKLICQCSKDTSG
jgi:hypothetical protein